MLHSFTLVFFILVFFIPSLVALLQGKGSCLLRCTVWLVDYKSFKNLLMLSEVQQKVLLLTKSLPLFTIIERAWAKYHDLSVASRSIFCQTWRLRQIIDLGDTKKSRYSAITEFNNCFIIPSLLFWLTSDVKLLSFSHKSVVSIMQEKNIIFSKTFSCGHLFSGRDVGCRLMKRKECIEW